MAPGTLERQKKRRRLTQWISIFWALLSMLFLFAEAFLRVMKPPLATTSQFFGAMALPMSIGILTSIGYVLIWRCPSCNASLQGL